MRIEVPPVAAMSPASAADRVRALVERMRKAMAAAARPDSSSTAIRLSVEAQRELLAAVDPLLLRNDQMVKRINECTAVLHQLAAKKWPHEQALRELVEYALIGAGTTVSRETATVSA